MAAQDAGSGDEGPRRRAQDPGGGRAHTPLQNLENNLESALDDLRAVGSQYIVCPFVPKEQRQTFDDWRRLARLFNQAGEKARQAGLQFCYHNHNFEFELFDGKPALEHLYEMTDPELVKAELDVYWIAYAGHDPAAYIRRYSGRVPIVHMKDMDPSDRSYAEVGFGSMDMPAILRAARDANVQWLVVEQDVCKRPVMDSARMSLEYLNAQRTSE